MPRTTAIDIRPARILLADADDPTRAFLTENLTADGYDVIPVATETTALAELAHGQTAMDLVLVDVNGCTLDLVDRLRADEPPLGATPGDVPVIVLTSRGEQLHRTRLLERGADDVVAKPFSYGELRARVAAVLRRTAPRQPSSVINVGELRIDLHDRRVSLAGEPIVLSATEYRLLCALAAEPTRVFTREELLRTVWGHSASSRTRTLDTHAHRLRAKLSGTDQPLIVNAWGVGYALNTPVAAPA
jgi:DNA-binding response OmpR family regulator